VETATLAESDVFAFLMAGDGLLMAGFRLVMAGFGADGGDLRFWLAGVGTGAGVGDFERRGGSAFSCALIDLFKGAGDCLGVGDFLAIVFVTGGAGDLVGLGGGFAAATGLGDGFAAATGLGDGFAAATGLGDGFAAATGLGDGFAAATGLGDGFSFFDFSASNFSTTSRQSDRLVRGSQVLCLAAQPSHLTRYSRFFPEPLTSHSFSTLNVFFFELLVVPLHAPQVLGQSLETCFLNCGYLQ